MDNTKKTLDTSIFVNGDIITFRDAKVNLKPMSWVEWAIRLLTKKPVNHAATFRWIDGKLYVDEMLGDGSESNIVNPRLLGEQVRISRCPYSKNKAEEIVYEIGCEKRAIETSNRKYNYWGILQQADEEITGKSIVKIEATPRPGEQLFCSERAAYINLPFYPKWRDTVPGDLYSDTRNTILFEGIVDKII